MRILLTHNNYTTQGGAEVFVEEVGRVLADQGHDVMRFAAAEPDVDAPMSNLFPNAADYKSGSLSKRATQLPKMIYNREAKARFAEAIAAFKPDVIHAFAIYVRLTPAILDAAREAGVPVVMSCNDYKHLCPNYKMFHSGRICEECKGGRFHRAIVNRCCHGSLAVSVASAAEAYVHDKMDLWRKNVDTFLFASEFMAQKTEEFWGKGTANIDFLRNPFDAEKYFVEPNVGDYMLYFGRLIDEKGVDVLMDAAVLAPDIPVVIVGDGPDREKLAKRAEGMPNVQVVGPAWGDDLAKWQHGARAVIVPSIWHENFPYVILQAFAAANPVIGAKRGGIPEMINAGDHGWTYDPTDPAELANRMRAVMGLPDDQIASMGQAAYDYTHRSFNDPAIYARLMEIYTKVSI